MGLLDQLAKQGLGGGDAQGPQTAQLSGLVPDSSQLSQRGGNLLRSLHH